MALFDTPSHVIPPVSALFTPFMESLVARKTTESSTKKENAGVAKKTATEETENPKLEVGSCYTLIFCVYLHLN